MARNDPELLLMVLGASTRERRESCSKPAAEAARRVDWARLAERLRAQRLLSMLGPRLVELAEREQPRAGDFAASVDSALQAARAKGGFQQLTCERLRDALAEQGIASAPLKGAALAETIYGDLGRRLCEDIDLLVAPERLAEAVETVRSFGYVATPGALDADGLPRLHIRLHHERGALAPVEIHWRIHWYERDFAREWLLEAEDETGPPARAAQLAVLLLFYARDGFMGLRHASDLAGWWDRYGAELDRRAFTELLDSYPALARPLTAAAAAAEHTVGVPRTLIYERPRTPRGRARLAVSLADPLPRRSSSQIYAEMGLVDGLLMPRGGLGAFVRRQLLLPREVLEGRSRRASDGSRPRTPLLARRAVRLGVLGRYAFALMRVARQSVAGA